MKALPFLGLVGLVAAAALLPFSVEATALAFFATGLFALALSDYASPPRKARSSPVPAPATVAAVVPAPRRERFRLAA